MTSCGSLWPQSSPQLYLFPLFCPPSTASTDSYALFCPLHSSPLISCRLLSYFLPSSPPLNSSPLLLSSPLLSQPLLSAPLLSSSQLFDSQLLFPPPTLSSPLFFLLPYCHLFASVSFSSAYPPRLSIFIQPIHKHIYKYLCVYIKPIYVSCTVKMIIHNPHWLFMWNGGVV